VERRRLPDAPIRVAAVADLHVDEQSAERWRDALANCSQDADVLLLGGDLTQLGRPEEAQAVLRALSRVTLPVLAVLGNHDFESGRAEAVRTILCEGGVHVLEGSAVTLSARGVRLGVAGVKGFGGGFRQASGSEFGEWEMKLFMRCTRVAAIRLERALEALSCDYRIALLHYAPAPDTLHGERREIYPFLGTHQLGDAIDAAGADLVLHGHAHAGRERGRTERGIPVRNVAQPVIGRAYRVYRLPGGITCRDRSRQFAL
jgi:Icc-related predicted phosphoesterase